MPSYCPTCGSKLEHKNAEICPYCGVRLREAKESDPCGCITVLGVCLILFGLLFLIISLIVPDNYSSVDPATKGSMDVVFVVVIISGVLLLARGAGKI